MNLMSNAMGADRARDAKSQSLFIFVLLGFLLGICFSASAQTFPPLTGRVVDAANILKPEERTALEAKLKAHEDATTEQVVVATVPSLEGTSIEDYANRLFRTWQLGQAGKNNGVLLLVASQERELRIEVGYGLEGTLTDALTKLVVANVVTPHFQQGRFADGIDEGIVTLLDILTGKTVRWQELLTANGPGEPVTGQARPPSFRDKLWFGFDPLVIIVIGTFVLTGAFILLMLFIGRKNWTFKTAKWSGHRSGVMTGRGRRRRKGFSGGGGSSGGGGASGKW
jgi:uncharacterized protein